MSRAMPVGPALFTASCWLLQPATAFVGPVHSGLRVVAPGSAHQHQRQHQHQHKYLHTRSFRARDALVLAAEAGDADMPGIADARLAGWRVASPVADSPDAAQDAASDASGAPNPEDDEPGCGDVVEYPLSDLVKSETDDDREKGVAVIVSINKHRNDAWKLPEDILDKAELQVLCPDLDNEEENIWMADELESCAFARLGEMKVLKSEFNGAMDKWKRWTISDELSEGCGSRDAEWEYDML
ncbi:unnamed protein product [Laminaria digitata]